MGGAIRKSKVELQNMCRADSSCVAIDYYAGSGYGHLCSSTVSTGLIYYEICTRLGIIDNEQSKYYR